MSFWGFYVPVAVDPHKGLKKRMQLGRVLRRRYTGISVSRLKIKRSMLCSCPLALSVNLVVEPCNHTFGPSRTSEISHEEGSPISPFEGSSGKAPVMGANSSKTPPRPRSRILLLCRPCVLTSES